MGTVAYLRNRSTRTHMKKAVLTTLLVSIAAFLFVSCQKEVAKSQKVQEISIHTTVAAGNDYLLELLPYGDEGDVAKITDKPQFAAVSKIENESEMFTSIYHYVSSKTAAGKTEHITITIQHYNGDVTLIYLDIDVA